MSKKRILVVDDEEDFAEVVSIALTSQGFEVVEVSSAKAALKKLEEDANFSLIITDVYMPEMDGIELIEEIRKVNEDIPTLFVMTGDPRFDAQVAKDKGAIDVIYKPFETSEFGQTIRRILGETEDD